MAKSAEYSKSNPNEVTHIAMSTINRMDSQVKRQPPRVVTGGDVVVALAPSVPDGEGGVEVEVVAEVVGGTEVVALRHSPNGIPSLSVWLTKTRIPF